MYSSLLYIYLSLYVCISTNAEQSCKIGASLIIEPIEAIQSSKAELDMLGTRLLTGSRTMTRLHWRGPFLHGQSMVSTETRCQAFLKTFGQPQVSLVAGLLFWYLPSFSNVCNTGYIVRLVCSCLIMCAAVAVLCLCFCLILLRLLQWLYQRQLARIL